MTRESLTSEHAARSKPSFPIWRIFYNFLKTSTIALIISYIYIYQTMIKNSVYVQFQAEFIINSTSPSRNSYALKNLIYINLRACFIAGSKNWS